MSSDKDDPLWPIKRAVMHGDAVPLSWVVEHSGNGDPVDNAFLKSQKPYLMALVIRDLNDDHVEAVFRKFRVNFAGRYSADASSVHDARRVRANAVYHMVGDVHRQLVGSGYSNIEAAERAPAKIADYFRDAIASNEIMTIQEVIAIQRELAAEK